MSALMIVAVKKKIVAVCSSNVLPVLPFCGFSPQICGIFKVTQSRRGFLCYGQFLWINLWNFLKVMDNFVDFKYFVDFLWAFEFNPSITLL